MYSTARIKGRELDMEICNFMCLGKLILDMTVNIYVHRSYKGIGILKEVEVA